jgi:hypothetical protein
MFLRVLVPSYMICNWVIVSLNDKQVLWWAGLPAHGEVAGLLRQEQF